MGNKNSRVSKDERKRRDATRETTVSNAIKNIENFKSPVETSSSLTIYSYVPSSNKYDPRKITPDESATSSDIASSSCNFGYINEIAKEQLSRIGKPLVKMDLIVILTVLSKFGSNLIDMKTLTVKELADAIRLEIYTKENIKRLIESGIKF